MSRNCCCCISASFTGNHHLVHFKKKPPRISHPRTFPHVLCGFSEGHLRATKIYSKTQPEILPSYIKIQILPWVSSQDIFLCLIQLKAFQELYPNQDLCRNLFCTLFSFSVSLVFPLKFFPSLHTRLSCMPAPHLRPGTSALQMACLFDIACSILNVSSKTYSPSMLSCVPHSSNIFNIRLQSLNPQTTNNQNSTMNCNSPGSTWKQWCSKTSQNCTVSVTDIVRPSALPVCLDTEIWLSKLLANRLWTKQESRAHCSVG